MPIIDFIQFHAFIADTLHMFIRIGNKLIKLLEERLNERNLFGQFENYIKTNIHLMNPSFEQNNQRVLVNLSGNNLVKLFSIINLTLLFPQLDQIDLINQVIYFIDILCYTNFKIGLLLFFYLRYGENFIQSIKILF